VEVFIKWLIDACSIVFVSEEEKRMKKKKDTRVLYIFQGPLKPNPTTGEMPGRAHVSDDIASVYLLRSSFLMVHIHYI
jgi:hypothetical protein